MTRQAVPRDWPLPSHAWEALMWLVIIALLSMSARQALGAEPSERLSVEPARPARACSGAPRSSAAAAAGEPSGVDDLLDGLAQVEDPALEDHVAAGSLTAGELALVIVFLILLFPVGIILLIVFLVDDD